MPKRTIPALLAAAVAASTLIAFAAGPAGAAAAYSPFTGTPTRWIIAHRGAPALYPEEGSRGYDRCRASGFPLEADARQLKDGTWVLLHDATVDRTMYGAKGAVDQLTLAQWRAARLRAAPSGLYPTDQPVTLADFLARYGGTAPILLEHKAGSVTAFISQIKSRGLQNSVMAQSFSWDTARQFKAAGLIPMYLMGTNLPVAPTTIRSTGIRHVGVSKDMGPANVKALRAAGLVVVSYTVNTRSNFNYEVNQGVNGSFSDNPWALR